MNCSFALAKLRALLARNRSETPQSVEISVTQDGGEECKISVMHRKDDEMSKGQEQNEFPCSEKNSGLRRPAFPDGFIWADETDGQNQQDSRLECRKVHSPNRSREMLRVARIDVDLSPGCGDSISTAARNSISLASVSDTSRPTSKESSKRRPASSSCNLRITASVPAPDGCKVIQANKQTVKYTTPSLKADRLRSYPLIDESDHEAHSAVITTNQVKGWRRVLVCQTTRDYRDAAMASPVTRAAASEARAQSESFSDTGQQARRGFLATDFWKHHSKVTEQQKAKIQRDRYELQSALTMTKTVHIGRHASVPGTAHGGRAAAVWASAEEEATRRPRGVERVPPLPNHFSGRCSFYNEAQCKVRQVLGRRPRRIAL